MVAAPPPLLLQDVKSAFVVTVIVGVVAAM
jgi:hypothetical protein